MLVVTSLDMPIYLMLILDVTNFMCLLLVERLEFSKKRIVRQDSNESIWNFKQLRTAITSWKGKMSEKRKKSQNQTQGLDSSFALNTDRRGIKLDFWSSVEEPGVRSKRAEDGGTRIETSYFKSPSLTTGINRSFDDKHQLNTTQQLLNKEAIMNGEPGVQAHNLESFASLGCIDEVVFDKTDVLTTGLLNLKQIATRLKNYQFDEKQFKNDISDFRGNPELFNQDDSIDEENHDENENYSEKTQEFVKELQGEYDSSILSSDDSLAEHIEKVSFPHYMPSKVASEDEIDGDETSIHFNNNHGSKLEEMNSIFNMLRGKKGDKSGLIPKGKGFSKDRDSKNEADTRSGKGVKQGGSPAKTAVEKLREQISPTKGHHFNMVPGGSLAPEFSLHQLTDGEKGSNSSLEDLMEGKRDNEEPILINFLKHHSTVNFIADLANRKHHLDELMTYIYLFQECGSLIEQRRHRRYNQGSETRSAFSEIYSEFGYTFLSSGRKDTTDAFAVVEQDIKPKNLAYVAKIKSNFGVVSNFAIKLVNDFTNNRKRMSLIVCDNEKGSDAHYLLVYGDEKHMRPCLSLGKKNKNQYKMLVSKYKAEGYKQLVIARKQLEPDEVENYLSSFISILKSSRDQLQNLEKLAISIETDLFYMGMIGVIDEIRPEAQRLCDTIKEAGVGMNIFSGDTLERCLYVVKKLNFSKVDFSRSGDYFHLNFKTEARANIEVKRMFDSIYEILKKADITEKNAVRVEIEKVQEKLKSEDEKDKTSDKRGGTREKVPIKVYETIMGQLLDVHERIPKKTLLISGMAVEVIMKSKHLTMCLQAASYMSDCIIMHSAQPSHSMFMVDLLRNKNKSVVLAIGDGFNFIGVCLKADVSIQIANPDVPLLFGDFLVRDLRIAAQLIFYNSFHIFKANLDTIFMELWRVLPYAIILGSFLLCSEFSGLLANEFHMLTFYLVAVLQILLSGMSIAPYRRGIIHKMYVLYCENKYSSSFVTHLIVYIVILSIIEAIYYSCVVNFYAGQDLSMTGRPIHSVEFIQDLVHLCMLVSGMLKFSFLSLRRVYFAAFLNISILVVFGGICVARAFYKSDPIEGSTYLRLLGTMTGWKYIVILVVVPAYLNYCIGLYFKAAYLTPFATTIKPNKNKKRLNDLGLMADFDRLVQKVRKVIFYTIHEFPIEHYIMKIKECFPKDSGYMPIQRIAFIDSFNNRLGLNQITNRIQDNGEAKRYIASRMRLERRMTQRLIIIFMVLIVVEYVLGYSLQGMTDYGLNTELPYTFVVTLYLLLATFVRNRSRMMYLSITFVMIINTMLTVVFTFARQDNTWSSGRFSFSRLLFSSLPLDFLMATFLGIVTDFFSYINTFLLTSFANRETNFSPMMKIRGAVYFFTYLVLKILLKKKYDKLLKYDFLSSMQLMNDINTSAEQLSMLMPDFVVERLNNFEISKNFVADDAGDITLLFCDVCNFDDIIKECQDQIVDILDDLFRAFDAICSKYGVQKIETVGKTYMACAGLKFIESKLSEAIFKTDPTIRIVNAAVDFMKHVSEKPYMAGKNFVLKIGVHYGSCNFGVLGYHKPQFSLIGDTVNTTSRHCTTGEENRIVLSEAAWYQIKDISSYKTTVDL